MKDGARLDGVKEGEAPDLHKSGKENSFQSERYNNNQNMILLIFFLAQAIR